MQSLRSTLINEPIVPHCCPSDNEEIKQFMYQDNIFNHQILHPNINDNLINFKCFNNYH